MFKNIDELHGAGVLDGYKGAAVGLPDFGRYNLIYGWNASGKTTLSRFFQLMGEVAGSKLPVGSYAKFSTEHGQLDTRNEQDRIRCPVRVFNRDFVDGNLELGHTNASANALFVVGSGNIRLSRRIALFTHQRQRMARIYKSTDERAVGAAKNHEKQATALASECGNLLGERNFRAPNLKNIVSLIGGDASTHLLSDDALQSGITAARDQATYRKLQSPLFSLPLRVPEAVDFASLLRGTPHQQTIDRLAQDRELSDWVHIGLHIHQGKTRCEFCGGDAAQALAEYAQHFSDEYQRQHSAIRVAIQSLENFVGTVALPHQNDWIPTLRGRFTAVEKRFQQWLQAEEGIRKAWLAQLMDKLDHMDTPIQVLTVEDRLADLKMIIGDLDALVVEHNQACDEMMATRQNAAECVRYHFAARYLVDPDSVGAANAESETMALLKRVTDVGKAIRDKLAAAQAELQRSSVAASEINECLRLIMSGRVSVEQELDGQLRFIRGDEPATNLSDGEKTAVSLAYFLVSLKQNGNQLAQTIVIIDDPICSLDANHIYDVAYVLLDQLKDAMQVFVLTHNSEFFNTVKREWTEGRKFKSGHRGYLVQRRGVGASELVVLPKHLANFRSDYHHVFYCLQKMCGDTSTDIGIYIGVPNLLRRFLEMYLGFRKPAGGSYVSKLDLLIDDEVSRNALARFVDEGSHNQSTLYLLGYADFPSIAKEMIGRVLQGMHSKDPGHYEALVEQVKDM